MKRLFRYFVRFLLCVFGLLFLIIIALYIPFIQDFATDKTADLLSRKTGWNISVGEVRLRFPLTLRIGEVEALTASSDTLMYLQRFETSVALSPLFKKQIHIRHILLQNAVMNMKGQMESMNLQGNVRQLDLSGIRVDLSTHKGEVKSILLQNTNVDMELLNSAPDTVAKETAPIDWAFSIGSLRITNSGYSLRDTTTQLDLGCFVGEGVLRNGELKLADNTYTVQNVLLKESSYRMDLDTLPPAAGFDPMHMDITGIRLQGDSIYNQGMKVKAVIREGAMTDRSGFVLTSLNGRYSMDSVSMQVSDFELKTPYSEIRMDAYWDQSIFRVPRSGVLQGKLNATLGYTDLTFFGETYFPGMMAHFPKENVTCELDLQGDMERLNLNVLKMILPEAFLVRSEGVLTHLDDIHRTGGEVSLKGDLYNLSFVPYLFPDTAMRSSLTIPRNLLLEGKLGVEAGLYKGRLSLYDGKSALNATGEYHPAGDKYAFRVEADSVHLARFLPTSGLGSTTLQISGNGNGFDPYAAITRTQIEGAVSRLDIGSHRISGLKINASLKDHLYDVVLQGSDTILLLNLDLNGSLTKNEITARLKSDIRNLNLYELKLSQLPIALAMQLNAEATTDLKQNYRLDAQLQNIVLTDRGVANKLGNLIFNGIITADSSRMDIRNGDMEMQFLAQAGLDTLLHSVTDFTTTLSRQLDKRKVDILTLQQQLPDLTLQFTAGMQNIFYGWMKNSVKMPYGSISLHAQNNREQGISMNGFIDNLRRDTLLINTLSVGVKQDSSRIDYQIMAESRNKNRKKAFTAFMDGAVRNDGLNTNVLLKNGEEKIGLDLGADLALSPEGITLRFQPYQPILLYRPWQINPDNFIRLTPEKSLAAKFNLTGEAGMELGIYATPSDSIRGMDQVRMFIRRFDLAKVSQAIPSLPPFSGIFNVDATAELIPDSINVTGKATLDSLIYNKQSLGDLVLNMGFNNKKDHETRANASMLYGEKEVASAFLYDNKADSTGLTASLDLSRFPLKLANPFIPDGMALLFGDLSGELKASGNISRPNVNGYLKMDTSRVNVTYANADYYLDNQQIRITDSKVYFDHFAVKAYNNNPLFLDGTFDFSNLNQMMTNLQVTGRNVELLNVRKQRGQMVFGKALMNVNTTVTGPVNFLKVRGSLNLLGGTNVTYVMLDAPVSAQNRVSNLVTFTSFNDTIDSNYQLEPQQHVVLSGIDMLVTIGIAQNVQLGIDLSTNGDDHVELLGGGDLAFRLTPMGSTDLSGRYNLTGGFVRYNLPVLPVAKTFQIQNGSYVEWTGPLMNPFINITAYETIRSTVTESGKGSRVVVFEPMILIRNRLEDLDVSFTVEAPEDISIQNQLAQMTPEERSKQAMNLIITQVYSGPGTTSKVNSNNALNAFIQKEINQFAGSALKGVDLSFGIDTYDQYGSDGSSGKRTDYSFRFSKKLFNDRFRIVLGGKVSSGQEAATDQNQAFIDDITLEYMLDQSGTRYLQLFHHTGYESVFEGEIVETGVGMVLRRKIRRLRQLFIFNNKRREAAVNADPENKSSVQPAKQDTIKNTDSVQEATEELKK